MWLPPHLHIIKILNNNIFYNKLKNNKTLTQTIKYNKKNSYKFAKYKIITI